ncbi:hypothetical protein H1C71_004812, partial [Ictidomys tridecemlineatus]
EENDSQIIFNYLAMNLVICFTFLRSLRSCSFIYYQASPHYDLVELGGGGCHCSLLWYFSTVGKSLSLSLVGTQKPVVANHWQEVPTSGISKSLPPKSTDISRCLIFKSYPWKHISKENVIKEYVNRLTQISALINLCVIGSK